jgi:hypothetical protein
MCLQRSRAPNALLCLAATRRLYGVQSYADLDVENKTKKRTGHAVTSWNQLWNHKKWLGSDITSRSLAEAVFLSDPNNIDGISYLCARYQLSMAQEGDIGVLISPIVQPEQYNARQNVCITKGYSNKAWHYGTSWHNKDNAFPGR